MMKINFRMNFGNLYRLFPLMMLLFGSTNFVNAQNCGFAEPTQAELDDLHQDLGGLTQGDVDAATSATQYISVSANILRKNNGTGGLTISQLEDAFDIVNDIYEPVGMVFQLCSVNEINNTNLYTFTTNEETQLNAYDVENTVNVYFFNTVHTTGGSSLCGYSRLPGGSNIDRVIMKNSCTLNGSTLSHEFGHYFGLLHTHGASNNCNSTNELADGSNCNDEGDFVCDTPADPNLGCSGAFNSSACDYIGSYLDDDGEEFDPATDNMMSYAYKPCRVDMTNGQLERALCTAVTARSYVLNTCNQADVYITNEAVSDVTPSLSQTIELSCNQCVSNATVSNYSPSVRVRFYLSDNTTLDASDLSLGYETSTIGTSDVCDGEDRNVTVTSSWGTGVKYILFKADDNATIAESDEDNNVEYVQINISSSTSSTDIFLTNQTLDNANPVTGDKVRIDCTQNVSGATVPIISPNIYVKFYLSSNTTYSSNDKYLGYAYSNIGTSDPADDEYLTRTVTSSWGSGSKYILIKADANSTVSESNENNNLKYIPINISQSGGRLGTDLEENSYELADFTIFPNPSKDFVNVTFERMNDVGTAILTDHTGKEFPIAYKKSSDNEMQLDVSNLNSGYYILTVSYGFGKTKSKKLLVQH